MSTLVALIYSVLSAQGQNYLPHKALDVYGSHRLAVSYLVPTGWAAHDSTIWYLQTPALPVSHSMVVSNPDGTIWLSYLNAVVYDYRLPWHDSRDGTRPPKVPSDYLVEDFKRVHPGTAFAIRTRSDSPIPYPSAPKGSGIQTQAYKSILQVQYEDRGAPTLMRLTCFSYGYTTQTGKNARHGVWVAKHLISLTSPIAEFQNSVRITRLVLLSQKEGAAFFQHQLDVTAMLQKKPANAEQKFRQIVSTTRPLTPGEQAALRSKDLDRDAASREFFR